MSKPSKQLPVTCNNCQKEFSKAPCYIKKQNFCSQECYHAWRINSQLIHEKRKPCSEERKRKISEAKMGNQNRLGAILTDETKQKISQHHIETGCFKGEKNPMFGKKHTEKTKQLMSDVVSKEIIEGKRKVYGKNGHQTGIYSSIKANNELYYRSSWELACMTWLDNALEVVSYVFESIKISYIWQDQQRNYKRHYIPDFLITFQDGHKELWELKPQKLTENLKTQLKAVAAKQYCEKNNIQTYRILTKSDLQQMNILL
jgi:hypothetical protein